MQKKFFVFGLLFLIIITSPISSATVSFLVIETGTPSEGSASRYSTMWENSLLDVFFESGHIVTNSPILRLTRKLDEGFPDEAERDFESAREGGMDFFIVAIVDHPAPHNVSLRLFRTSSQEMILEYKYMDKTYRSQKEESDTIKNDIMGLAARLQ